VPVTSLDEVPAKCKVQFWPKGMYGAAVQPLTVPTRKITMLIMTNEVFVHSHRVVAEASSVAELVATACAKLEGAVDPADYFLSLEAGVEVASFDDVPDKAKVSVCLRDATAAAAPAAGPRGISFAEDTDGSGVTAGADLRKSYAAGEYGGVLSPSEGELAAYAAEATADGADAARDFLLMVTVNDTVLNAKKLKITAVDIDELFDKVAEGLGLNEPVFVCPVASSVHDAEPYGSLAEISDKAKVSVWPVRCFEEAEEDEAPPAPAGRGISFAEDPAPAPTGISFAQDTDGSGVTAGADLRKSYVPKHKRSSWAASRLCALVCCSDNNRLRIVCLVPCMCCVARKRVYFSTHPPLALFPAWLQLTSGNTIVRPQVRCGRVWWPAPAGRFGGGGCRSTSAAWHQLRRRY